LSAIRSPADLDHRYVADNIFFAGPVFRHGPSVTLGQGALIAGLVSSPAMIRRQWNVTRLPRHLGAAKSSNAQSNASA
jgi:hypothetical protein